MGLQSLKEIDAEIAKLQALRQKAEAEEIEAAREENVKEARVILARLTEDLHRLEQIGFVPPRILSALSNEAGKFSPGLYIKRPRGGSA